MSATSIGRSAFFQAGNPSTWFLTFVHPRRCSVSAARGLRLSVPQQTTIGVDLSGTESVIRNSRLASRNHEMACRADGAACKIALPDRAHVYENRIRIGLQNRLESGRINVGNAGFYLAPGLPTCCGYGVLSERGCSKACRQIQTAPTRVRRSQFPPPGHGDPTIN